MAKPSDSKERSQGEFARTIADLQSTIRGLPDAFATIFSRVSTIRDGSPKEKDTFRESEDGTNAVLDALARIPSQMTSAFRANRSFPIGRESGGNRNDHAWTWAGDKAFRAAKANLPKYDATSPFTPANASKFRGEQGAAASTSSVVQPIVNAIGQGWSKVATGAYGGKTPGMAPNPWSKFTGEARGGKPASNPWAKVAPSAFGSNSSAPIPNPWAKVAGGAFNPKTPGPQSKNQGTWWGNQPFVQPPNPWTKVTGGNAKPPGPPPKPQPTWWGNQPFVQPPNPWTKVTGTYNKFQAPLTPTVKTPTTQWPKGMYSDPWAAFKKGPDPWTAFKGGNKSGPIDFARLWAKPPFVGPPTPAWHTRRKKSTPFFATMRRSFNRGRTKSRTWTASRFAKGDAMIGAAMGRKAVAAFSKLASAAGAISSVFGGIGTAAKLIHGSIQYAEGVNNSNRRFAGYNAGIAFGYSSLGTGDTRRNMAEARANEKPIMNLTASINGLRDSWSAFDKFKTGFMTRAGSAAAEFGRIVGEGYAPAFNWLNERLENNDPNGDWTQRQIRKIGATRDWFGALIGSGFDMKTAQSFYDAYMKGPAPQMAPNDWGAALWEMKNPPVPALPPAPRQPPANPFNAGIGGAKIP